MIYLIIIIKGVLIMEDKLLQKILLALAITIFIWFTLSWIEAMFVHAYYSEYCTANLFNLLLKIKP